MKVAIVHDALIMYGGAEVVLDNLLELFPEADLFTLAYNADSSVSKYQSRIKKVLIQDRSFAPRRTVTKLKGDLVWSELDLSEYELVISSSAEFSAKSVITLPDTLHVCYCHTPPRYLYPEKPNYYSYPSKLPWLRNAILSYLRLSDFAAAQRVDVMLANSLTVQRRITKYYRRQAEVIYPPVALADASVKLTPTEKRNLYLSIGRLTPVKGTQLVVKAFNKLGKKLVIIGDGVERSNLQRLAGSSVTFLGFCDEATKQQYLRQARGLVFAAADEDFGIAPVEAMASGTPVIAYKSGGSTETVVDGQTGVLFADRSVDAVCEAVERLETISINPDVCQRRAKRFSKALFQRRFKRIVVRSFSSK